MSTTDFTDATVRHPKAKQDTRIRPLDLIREHSSALWSREHQALRHDWMELAGRRAPTLATLLERDALKPESLPAQFIGVDTSSAVLASCRDHYEADAPASWVNGNLISLLRDAKAYTGVGVLVYDSLRAVRGKTTIEQDLPVLARFAQRQYDRLGEFLLVLNVTRQERFNDQADVEHYRDLVERHFGVRPDLHAYRSKRSPMLWTAIRLGF